MDSWGDSFLKNGFSLAGIGFILPGYCSAMGLDFALDFVACLVVLFITLTFLSFGVVVVTTATPAFWANIFQPLFWLQIPALRLNDLSGNWGFELKNGFGFWGRGLIAGERFEPTTTLTTH